MVPKVWFQFTGAGFVVGCLVLVASAQSPQFKSATIRPSADSADGRQGVLFGDNGLFTATNVTLKQLIENGYRRFAYDRREVTGGPEWIGVDRFDITADAGGQHALDAAGFARGSLPMLQRLLEDRFQLRLRHDKPPRPVYALTAGDPASSRPTPAAADCAAVVRAEARGERSQKVLCGVSIYPGRLVARGVTLADFAALLSPHLDRPVIDRTGISGTFDIELEAADFRPAGPFGPSYRPSDTKESIFNAVVSQLGLQLEKTTAPVEVLVIEHAEKPVTLPPSGAQPAWRDPSPHRVRFVPVESTVRLEVLDWGGSGRPILFLGCYITGHAFDDIGPKLIDQFHVYAFTRRGIGASDRPPAGYDLQRAVDDLVEVMDALKLRKPILVANSCGGWTQTLLAVQHPDRLGGLVYLEAADDPMLALADYNLPLIDEANLPKRLEPPALDYSSFEAYRRTQKARSGVAFPEAELRYGFVLKPDGSVGQSLLSPTVRRAITTDSRRTPDYARVRVPVLAVFQTPPPFEEIAMGYSILNDLQRTTLRQQQVDVEKIMTARWERDLRAGVPTAKIVELPGASLFMFLSNEADVMRELRAFIPTLKQE